MSSPRPRLAAAFPALALPALAFAALSLAALPCRAGDDAAAAARPPASAALPARALDELRRAVAAQREAIHAIYLQALASQPALQGRVILQLVVAASGRIADCRVVDDSLHAGALTEHLVAIARGLQLAAEDVAPLTVRLPVEFNPAPN